MRPICYLGLAFLILGCQSLPTMTRTGAVKEIIIGDSLAPLEHHWSYQQTRAMKCDGSTSEGRRCASCCWIPPQTSSCHANTISEVG